MAIRISPPQNKTYYINPAHLTFNENSGYGANLIQVSASSSCYISVYDPANGIGYSDADRNYRRWKVTAYNNKFPDDKPEQRGEWYIYVRLERDGLSALVVYDQVLRGVKGGEVTVSKDESGNDVYTEAEPEQDTYWFIRIGDVGATDGTSIRSIVYDTGYLTSDEGRDTAELNEMWELDKYSTPWLIRAKQWLAGFSVKGLIKLMGGLIFSSSDGTNEKLISDVKRSFDSDEDVPVDDFSVPTTAWVDGHMDDRFLRKDKEDETNYKIKFFDGIECGQYVTGMLGGSGTRFDGEGYGEMNGLTLREFLEVPELRFNRVDVISGELWNSVAFGLVAAVDIESQTCTLKLEENERAGLLEGDICRGIFADFGDGDLWEGTDDYNFLHLYGFKTVYFSVTEILVNEKGAFSFVYSLPQGSTEHPSVSMKFAVYGTFDYIRHPERMASAYSTRTYKRYLNGVDDWKIDPDRHIYAQYGDLNGLTIGGVVMQGYGLFQSNAYFRGVQIQLPPEQMEELRGESAYSVVLSSNSDVVVLDSAGGMGGAYEQYNVVTGGDNVVSGGKNVVTSVFKLKTDVQVRKGSKALYYSAYESEGSYTLVIDPVGCEAVIMNGLVVVSKILDTGNCHVNIKVNCEGKATYNLMYRVAFVKDGKVGKDGEDTVAYRITPNLSTLGKTMTGTVDPESVTFSLHRHQGEKSALYPCLWVLEGRNSGSQEWTFVSSSNYPTESWAVVFKGGYKYYRVQATNSKDNTLYEEREITVVSDGKSGSMARYRGEFVFYNQSEPYVYNDEYRDVVLYEGNVYQVYAYGSSVTDTPSVSANSDNDGKWQRANQFRFVAMDTALIDNANIAGFTFSRNKYINGVPVGVMRSQYGPVCIYSVPESFESGTEIGISINGTVAREVRVRKFSQVAYELVPIVSRIVRRKKDDVWVYDQSQVSCSIRKITEGGSTTVTSVNGYTLKYSKDGGSQTIGNSATTGGVSSEITFILYDSENIYIERQTIPVLSEGSTSVKAVVENENIGLLVNDAGKVVSGLPHRFKITLWKGIEEIGITRMDFSNKNGLDIVNELIEIDTESGSMKCTNASISGEVNATGGTFSNVRIENAVLENGLCMAEISSDAVDGFPGISWDYNGTNYARMGMWVVNGQVSGVVSLSDNSTTEEMAKLYPGMLVLSAKKTGFNSRFESLLSNDSLWFVDESSINSAGMFVDSLGRFMISSDCWPLESSVTDGGVYVDGSGYVRVKNPKRV